MQTKRNQHKGSSSARAWSPAETGFGDGWGHQDSNSFPEKGSVQVVVSFGASVLHVGHVQQGGVFVMGEGDRGMPVDFEVHGEALGCERVCVVSCEGDTWVAFLPAGVPALVATSPDQEQEHFLLRRGIEDEGDTPRDHFVVLDEEKVVRLEFPQVSVSVRFAAATPRLPAGGFGAWDWSFSGYFAASLSTFAGLLLTLAWFAPPLGVSDEDLLNQKRLLLLSQYLDAASEREREREASPRKESGEAGGQAAQPSPGPEGKVGERATLRAKGRAAVRGTEKEVVATRAQALEEARNFGLLGLLHASAGGPPSPDSVFGREASLGSDESSLAGSFWDEGLGESGTFGLGRLGAGSGGNDLMGRGAGIDMGGVGTLGPGKGTEGFGSFLGRSGGTHRARAPSVRSAGTPSGNGRLPPQVIQRVVRQNFGRFRLCYERGLGMNPSLEGRVSVRFVIGSDGSVTTAAASGDLSDGTVKDCVAGAFYGLSFPAPEGGVVSVTYPLLFVPE